MPQYQSYHLLTETCPDCGKVMQLEFYATPNLKTATCYKDGVFGAVTATCKQPDCTWYDVTLSPDIHRTLDDHTRKQYRDLVARLRPSSNAFIA